MDIGKWYKPGLPKLLNIYQYTAGLTPSALACLPSHSIVKPKAQKSKAALDKEELPWVTGPGQSWPTATPLGGSP